MTKQEVINKVNHNGLYYVNGIGHKPRIENNLPKNKLYCSSCRESTISAIAGCYLYSSSKEGIISICNKCKKIRVIPKSTFIEEEKRKYQSFAKPKVNFNVTKETIQRRILELKGIDEEDIKEICDIYREDWKKEDEIEAKRVEREKADREYQYKENERIKEQKSFKARLDAGEIKFDKGSSSFYEVATGKIIKKLR